MKIYLYNDFARFLLDHVEHRYRNRGDKLYKRMFYPFLHKTVDYYLPGQICIGKRSNKSKQVIEKYISIQQILNQV